MQRSEWLTIVLEIFDGLCKRGMVLAAQLSHNLNVTPGVRKGSETTVDRCYLPFTFS